MRQLERFDNWEMRDVVITFRNSALALYDDRKAKAKKLDVGLPQDPLTAYTVQFLRGLVETTDESNCGELLAILGRHLFEFVFGSNPRQNGSELHRPDASEARRRFEDVLTWADEEESHFVNLRLNFEEDARALAVWPWEFLWYPGGTSGWDGYFLRTKRVSVLREVNSQRNMNARNPPVRVLLATSGPSNLPDIGAADMTDVLTPHRDANPARIDLRLADGLRFGELKHEIEDFKPNVFHFHGHGDGSGGVTLPHARRKGLTEFRFTSENTDSGVDTDAEAVASLFRHHQPQLILISACDTALDEVPFADVAQQLAEIGVPAVAAMQFKLKPTTATKFAEGFYEELIKGALIAPAFAAGLEKLTVENATEHGSMRATRDFGTPVLFLNSTESRLVTRTDSDRTDNSSPDTRAEYPPPGQRECVYCGWVGPRSKFCGDCGREVVCKSCGEPIVPPGVFCIGCQRRIPLPPRDDGSASDAPNLRVVQPKAGPPQQGNLSNPTTLAAGQ